MPFNENPTPTYGAEPTQVVPQTRQYIGARYVPKLAEPFEWNENTAYEGLTIVGYYGSSYTSRKPVPPGIVPQEGEYWALTGNLNGSITDLQNQVTVLNKTVTVQAGQISDNAADIKTNADNIKTVNGNLVEAVTNLNSDIVKLQTDLSNIIQKRTILIITDSYGTTVNGVTPYTTLVTARLDNVADIEDVLVDAVSGAGFGASTGKQFLTMVNEWAIRYPTLLKKITDIYILGGANDVNLTSTVDIPALINAVHTAVKTSYPNAKLHVGFLSKYYPTTNVSANSNMAKAYKTGTLKAGANFLTSLSYALVWRTLFQSDEVHPNATGAEIAAEAVTNVILGTDYQYSNLVTIRANGPDNAPFFIQISPFQNGQWCVFNLRVNTIKNGSISAGEYTFTFESPFPLPGKDVIPTWEVMVHNTEVTVNILNSTTARVLLWEDLAITEGGGRVRGPFKITEDALYL